MKKRTLLSWSSGKDSAWALYQMRRDPAIAVEGLFSVMNKRVNRVSMHATRAALLERQAKAAGLPFQSIYLPDPCTNEQADDIMGEFVHQAARQGVDCMAFGDLFLEDVRKYREEQLKGTGIEPVFPLWQIPTRELAEKMLDGGVKAYISSVDLKQLPAEFAGREWNKGLLDQLPPDVDPCGENGEIHTVVVDGPMFSHAISVEIGEVIEREGFAFADIIPGS